MADKQRRLAAYQARAKRNPTKAEALVLEALEKAGAVFRFQKGFLRDDTIRLVDFYFTLGGRRSVCLEIDGGYHNDQKEYDAYREGRIKSQRSEGNLTFVRVTNEWVFDQPDLAESIRALIPFRVKLGPKECLTPDP
jgi:very-short-patch-repair endonuclease